mmetsp:Transcript_17723/g.35620  ORF Transcript_17723/g.35620 Transcript_17723/m.35620 type:complete len:87 (+) Transcript_17723:71-331(+)
MPDFNHDFDKAHEEHLILALQQEVGCFACGKYASSGCDGITKPRCKGLRACTKCKVSGRAESRGFYFVYSGLLLRGTNKYDRMSVE